VTDLLALFAGVTSTTPAAAQMVPSPAASGMGLPNQDVRHEGLPPEQHAASQRVDLFNTTHDHQPASGTKPVPLGLAATASAPNLNAPRGMNSKNRTCYSSLGFYPKSFKISASIDIIRVARRDRDGGGQTTLIKQ
jgi:hypothetical protein